MSEAGSGAERGGAKPTVRERVRAAWKRLRGGELTPARAAASVALGLFVGCIPIYGGQVFLCLALALALRLDFPVAYLAANVSNPLTVAFITGAEIELGALVLRGSFIPWSIEHARHIPVADALGFVALGAVLLGAPLALVGGALTFALVPSRTGDAALGRAIARTAERYRAAGRPAYHYVRSKLAHDPAIAAIAALEGELGEIVDVGAGRGQLAVLLLELGRATRARGFDWDARKVEMGRRAAAAGEPLAATFEVADARTAPIERADTVLVIDVLHYLARDDQDALLVRAARALAPGGRLLVRELDGAAGLRARLTELEERIVTAVGYNRAGRLAFRPIADVVRVLEREGLRCERIAASEGSALANVLVVARLNR